MNAIFQVMTQHKNLILLTVGILCLLTIYPPLFKTIYESGRDFGRSLINAWLSHTG